MSNSKLEELIDDIKEFIAPNWRDTIKKIEENRTEFYICSPNNYNYFINYIDNMDESGMIKESLKTLFVCDNYYLDDSEIIKYTKPKEKDFSVFGAMKDF